MDRPDLGGWLEVLAPLRTTLVRSMPPRWTFHSGRGRAITAELAWVGDRPALALSADVPEAWSTLYLVPRGIALDTRAVLVTGDDAFDAAAALAIDHEVVRGLCHRVGREAMSTFVDCGGVVAGGSMRLAPLSGATPVFELQAVLSAFERLLDQLAVTSHDDALAAIDEIARHDSSPQVRARFEVYAQSTAVRRVMAGRDISALGTAKEADFQRLVEHLSDRKLGNKVRASAAYSLLASIPLARLGALDAQLWSGLTLDDLAQAPLVSALRAQHGDGTVAARGAANILHALGGGSMPVAHGDIELWEALLTGLAGGVRRSDRTWLMQLAERRWPTLVDLVAARLIESFDNAALLDVLQAGPRSMATLLGIPGVSERLMERLADRLGNESTSDEERRIILDAFTRPSNAMGVDFDKVLAAVSKVPHAASLPVIAKALGADERWVVRAALRALIRQPIDVHTALEALPTRAREAARREAPEVMAEEFGGADPGPLANRAGALLAALYVSVGDGYFTTRRAYLRAFAAVGDPGCTAVVLRDLDSADEAVRDDAIAALARMGNLSAIPKLRPLSGGLFRPAALKQAAQAAIDAITQRAVADPSGGLSVADDDARGGLALGDGADT